MRPPRPTAVATTVVLSAGLAIASARAQESAGRTLAASSDVVQPAGPRDTGASSATTSDARGTAAASKGQAAVVVECLSSHTQLLEEALIRARAEVTAAGLTVIGPREQVSGADDSPWRDNPDVYGRLSFEQFGSVIRIEALSPGLSEPVVQNIDSEAPGVDAEVIAVRAVEALRAAMVQYAASADRARRELPAVVGRFARVKSRATPRRAPENKAPRSPSQPPSETRPESRDGVLLSLWLAPEARVDLRAGEASGGGRVQLYGGADWCAVGVGVRQVWGLNSIARDEGRALTRRTDVELSLKLEGAVGSSTSVYVATNGGYRQYVIEGHAAAALTAFDRQHATVAGALELGAAQQLADQLGIFLGCGITAAADAPLLYFNGTRVAKLDRPSLWVSLGVIAGQH